MTGGLPPVVLVHGWGGSFEGTWGDTGWREALASAGRRVVERDLPGHGPGPVSHDPADYADVVSGFDAWLPAGPLDAVGFSLGGKVVLELASRAPDRFRRIVVGGLGDNIFSADLGHAAAEAFDRGFPADARARMPVLARYIDESRNDLKALAAVNRRPHNPRAEVARLQAIRSDILLVNGTADTVAEPDDRLRAALPRARHLALPDVDHFTLHRQQEFRRAALDFLNA